MNADRIDPRTGRTPPCPNCGAAGAIWRRRRWYDVLRTWMRYIVEVPLSLLFRTPKAHGGIGQTGHHISYEAAREAYDEKMATATARWFWKCRECKREGDVFDDLGASDMIAHLTSIEADLAENRGGAVDPVSGPRT